MGSGEDSSPGGRPPTVGQILHDAAKLLGRSRKTILFIYLLLLLPYTLLFLGNYLAVAPLGADAVTKFLFMLTKDSRSPEYGKLLAAVVEDLRGITGAELVAMPISQLLLAFLVMATVYTVAMASKGEQVTLKELLSRIARTWKGPVATQLHVAVISFGCTTYLLLLIGAFAFASDGCVVLHAMASAMPVPAFLLLVYLQVGWYQGLVISVVEEDCYGLAALGRASELIRGRRRLGLSVSCHLVLIHFVFYMAYYYVKQQLPPGETTELAAGLVFLYANLAKSVFMLAVFVVFYYECRKKHGEPVGALTESLLYYSRAPTTAPALGGDLP